MSRFKLNKEKLKHAVCFVVENCDQSDLGAVKLHKILYYSDMLFYLETGKPITGATYRKRPFGPTCDTLLKVLPELEAEGTIGIKEKNYFGYMKKEYISLRKCNYSSLSTDETEVLRSMVNFVCQNNTAKTISDFSHDIVWEMVDFGQDIPYHSVLNWLPTEVTDQLVDDAENLWGEFESQRPVRASELEGRAPSPLRARLVAHSRQ